MQKTTKQTKKGYLKHVPSSPNSVKSGHMRSTQDFHAEENFAYCSKRKIAWLKAISGLCGFYALGIPKAV